MPRIIGIDPGLASTGWGVIDGGGGRIQHVDHGVFRTAASDEPGTRLLRIYDLLVERLETFRPNKAGIESLYFTKNTTSAIPVAQARGVVLLALARFGVYAREFTPQVIKQSVVGTGQADKEQVMQMVRVILGMGSVPKPDHAADALAAAITMLHSG